MSRHRPWWRNAIEKAKSSRTAIDLVAEAEREAYTHFIRSRLGGAACAGATGRTANKFGAAAPMRKKHVTAAVPDAVKNPRSSIAKLAKTAPRFRRKDRVPAPPASMTDGERKLGYELDDEGTRRLVCAVVELAVTDFKTLTRRGRIVNNKAMPSKLEGVARDYDYEDPVKQLLHFFSPGGPMDSLFKAAAIKINPNLVRERLGIA